MSDTQPPRPNIMVIDHEADVLLFGTPRAPWAAVKKALDTEAVLVWRRSGLWGVIPRAILLNLWTTYQDYLIQAGPKSRPRRPPPDMGVVRWGQVLSPPQPVRAVSLSKQPRPRRRPSR